jgi:hypothetical protein
MFMIEVDLKHLLPPTDQLNVSDVCTAIDVQRGKFAAELQI